MKQRLLKCLVIGTFRGLTALLLVFTLFAAIGPQTALAASFTVNDTADTLDASPGNGVCADASNNCTLRAAIMEANALAGADTITVPAGTYTLTRAGSDDTAINGDLDVTGPIIINGAGQGSTIIQTGTTNSNGIDKVFSFNPLGTGAGFTVSMNDLTLRFGKNPDTYAGGNGFGGCFDFDSGTNGAGSFTMTNVTVTDCQTTDADGGGGAIFLTSGSGIISISGSTIQNNTAHRPAANFGVGGGLFFGCAGGSGATVTISGSTISSNHAQDNNAQGGGIFAFGACSGTPTLNYQMHNVAISGNQAANDGGGMYSTAPWTIDNTGGATVISNNSSGRNGGGLWLNHTNSTSNITKVTISGNSASSPGGGIYLGTSTTSNVLNLSFSRIVNNTSSGGGSGLSVAGGTANANNNWWGCSTGPSAAPCDTAGAGAGSLTFTPWLRVLTTASPGTILTNQTSSLTASVNTNSAGTDVSANNALLKGLAVTWSAVGGNLSGAQTTIQPDGTATATYTANAAQAGNLAAAKVDNDGTTSGSNVASITVNKADTTTTISSDTPDPTVTGQAYTVTYSVTSSTGSTPTAPTGNVAVSDGTSSCIGTVSAGQCTLISTMAGSKTLMATYVGNGNFLPSTSASVAHQVDKAVTTTTLMSDSPDPSVVGQSVTVQYSVSVNAPGSGIPTGNVTVSDGSVSCTATVAAGQCALTFTGAGAKSLTATYASDSNFNGSTSVTEAHTVNPANTTVTITSDSPDPSSVGQVVTVNFTVALVAPGAGTPAGNVTVSDGVDSCTGTAASGTCTITLTTGGARTLTATYAGNSSFNSSTSAGEPHAVNQFATSTTITSDNPDPSVVGQAVTVQYSVTSRSGTPTGNVTVSDGAVSCTGTVAAGQCSLAFTSAGAKSLTATYAGNSNFSSSTSAAEAHQVNRANTTTTITSDNPDPSAGGQSVTVNYQVSATAPGAGTPTGNVTVSDGLDSCTGTLAAGSCGITLTTGGARTLTATYAGDSNFNGSVSAGEPHFVDITPPDVTIDQASGQADPTGVSPINFQVVFTEVVTGFGDGPSDVTLSGTAGATTAVVTGGPTTYNVAVSGITGAGTVIASIPAGAASDAHGNPSTASTSTDNTVSFFGNVPLTVVSSVRADPNPTFATSVHFTVIFSESVTGVDSSDFDLTTSGLAGSTVTGVSGPGSVYTVTVNVGTGSSGTLRLDVLDDDSIKDAFNNPLGGTGVGNGNFSGGEAYTIVRTGGADTTGVFRPSNGVIFLKNQNTTGIADIGLNYGNPDDYPVVGDWDGNGTTTIGVYRNGTFYLRNSNTVGFGEIVFAFGTPGDQPIAGDWDGNGIDTIGVYRPSTAQFLLRNSNSAGPADLTFALGNPGDVGIAGDWDGDGIDTTGVFRPSNGVIFLKNANTTGIADVGLNYGIPGDKPVTGDWDNDGIDTIGVYRNGLFYLRNSNTVGFAEIVFGLGNPGDMPIAGNWDGIP